MRITPWRFSLAAIGAAALALAGGSAGAATPASSGAHQAHHKVGDKCLVGTWLAGHSRTRTEFDGHSVVMHAGGGDVMHVTKSGTNHDNWKKSLPLTGHFQGHPLTEVIRGTNTQLLHATKVGKHLELTVTERGWSAGSTNRYTYRGHHRPGYLSQVGVHTYRFTCTATTLTLLGPKGHRIGVATRTSRKP
ncbi:MAG TPA: hypothetical protein VME70_13180 [Mycobacteriales bacterium]|nr:hypothetical protein [Mycobacteriales bacterium]